MLGFANHIGEFSVASWKKNAQVPLLIVVTRSDIKL